jgi:hypothetical protein
MPAEPRRDWESPVPAGIDSADGGFLYDLGGAPTVDRAAINVGNANVLLRASLDCRMTARDPWMRAYDGLFYELRRGANALASDPALCLRAAAGTGNCRSGAPIRRPIPRSGSVGGRTG